MSKDEAKERLWEAFEAALPSLRHDPPFSNPGHAVFEWDGHEFEVRVFVYRPRRLPTEEER